MNEKMYFPSKAAEIMFNDLKAIDDASKYCFCGNELLLEEEKNARICRECV